MENLQKKEIPDFWAVSEQVTIIFMFVVILGIGLWGIWTLDPYFAIGLVITGIILVGVPLAITAVYMLIRRRLVINKQEQEDNNRAI